MKPKDLKLSIDQAVKRELKAATESITESCLEALGLDEPFPYAAFSGSGDIYVSISTDEQLTWEVSWDDFVRVSLDRIDERGLVLFKSKLESALALVNQQLSEI